MIKAAEREEWTKPKTFPIVMISYFCQTMRFDGKINRSKLHNLKSFSCAVVVMLMMPG